MQLRYPDLSVIDMHAHIMEPHSLMPERDFLQPTLENAQSMVEMLECCGYRALNIPAVTLYDPVDLPCNPLSLYAKTLCPGRIYAFAGLVRELDVAKNAGMPEQLQRLLAAGFDGVKMICKPNARRVWNVPIDDPIFDETYGLMEDMAVPLLFHVGDPATFWDPEAVPGWARANGWYYGDDRTIPDLPGLLAEVERMLARHPRLHAVFAHFLFLSGDLTYAARFLDRYPNVCFDLTPGSEMYLDFSGSREESRRFFLAYQDRLLYGTDNVGSNGGHREAGLRECAERASTLRRFFETDGEIAYWQASLKGLGLPREVCAKLYSRNFLKLVGGKPPKAVDTAAAARLCGEYRRRLPRQDDATGLLLGRMKERFASGKNSHRT